MAEVNQDTETPPVLDKSKRDVRKEAREQRRTASAEKLIANEAGVQGIDFDKIIRSTPADEASTTKAIEEATRKAASQDYLTQIQGNLDLIQKSRPDTSVPTPDKKALVESAKLERRTAIWDALGKFGAGLSRQNFQGVGDEERAMREGKYKEYLEGTKRAQQTANAWKLQRLGQIQQTIERARANKNLTEQQTQNLEEANRAFELQKTEMLIGMGLDPNTDLKSIDVTKTIPYKQAKTQETRATADLMQEKRLLEKYQSDIAKTKAGIKYQTESLGDGTWGLSHAENQYSDVFNKIVPNGQALINEIAILGGAAVDEDGNIKSPLKEDEVNRYANNLLSSMYNTYLNADGRTILVPKPGAEAKLKSLQDSFTALREAKTAQESLAFPPDYDSLSRSKKQDATAKYYAAEAEIKRKIQEARSKLIQAISGKGETSPTGEAQQGGLTPEAQEKAKQVYGE